MVNAKVKRTAKAKAKAAKKTAKKNTAKTKRAAKTKEMKRRSLKEFEFLDHTADAKFIAYGKSFSGALANAAKATVNVMTDIKKIKPKQTKKISIESKTKESLVYDFIEKIIFLIDTEGFLVSSIRRIKIARKDNLLALTAEFEGDNAKNYDVHTCIKAVTYNDMQIEETEKDCTIQVVLDI